MLERLKNFDLSGFRTIIVAVLAILGVVAGKYGFKFNVEDQSVVATSVMSVLMILLRVVTKTPVGESQKEADK